MIIYFSALYILINQQHGDDVLQRKVPHPGEGGRGVVWGSVQGTQQGEQVNGGDKKVQIIGQSGVAD